MLKAVKILVTLSSVLVAIASREAVQIKLDTPLQFSVGADETKLFQLQLPFYNNSNSDLFFVVQYPTNDPMQEPSMTVTTSDGYLKSCYSAQDEFSGVCNVPRSQLGSSMDIQVQVKCRVQCHLTMNAFLHTRLKLTIGDQIALMAPNDHGMPVQIELYVPTTLVFTQIGVFATIVNFHNVSEGMQLFANIGDQNTQIPSAQMYDEEGESTYWGGQGLYFSREYISPGYWIKIYLYLSEGMQVKLYSIYMNGNKYPIDIGTAYFDFTSASEDKIYMLDLNTSKVPTQDKAVLILFVIYGGYPVIDISFDSNFTRVLESLNSMGTINYVVTAEQRRAANASSKIYIRVHSGWNADYYLYTTIQQDSFMTIVPDMNYYSQLQPGEVYNYFFDELISNWQQNDEMRMYSIQVDSVNGFGTLGVRRCRDFQSARPLSSCVIQSISQLTNSTVYESFKEIKMTVKSAGTYTTILFQYNLSQCSPIGNGSKPLGRYCSFQIIGADYTNSSIDYILTLNKRRYAVILREGTTLKELIFKDQYLYFKLGLSSLEDVESVMVYATVIEGGIYIFSSTQDQYPTFETDYRLIKSSTGNNLFYTRSQIASNIYITVYGLDFSQFTLAIVINRVKNKTNSTADANASSVANSSIGQIGLQLDLSQQFTMQQKDTKAIFTIQTSQSLNITVEVIKLAGTVSLQVFDSSNNAVECRDATVTTSKLTCSLTTDPAKMYTVIILASEGFTQKFIILYHKEENCIPFILNKPLFVQLDPGQEGCTVVSISKATSLQVTTSVSLLQILSKSLLLEVCIEKHCFQQVSSHHRTISRPELSSFCQFGTAATSNSCKIKLSYRANYESSVHFSLIVQEEGKNIGLFDGISEKISNFELSQTNGKYFYYPIYSYASLKIIFTSFGRSSYYLAAQFQSETDFFKGVGEVYLPYHETNDPSTDPNLNLFEATFSGSSKILTITPASIRKFCNNSCVLTVSVYANQDNTQRLSTFQIQVTQHETQLLAGDSKVGYLGQDEVYNYQLDGGHSGNAFIYLKDLGKQSSGQQDCFIAELTDFYDKDSKPITSGYTYITQDSQWANLYVTASEEICNYEVSYTLTDYPLLTIAINEKQTVSLRGSSLSYYLYYHASNQSFRIVQEVETGSALIFVSPIYPNQTIQDLMSADPSEFPFVNSNQLSIFTISNASKDFCFNCDYLIVVKGSPSVNSELLVLNLTGSIPLSINGILRQKIKPNDPIHQYSFYSISSFNVTISIKYGSLRVNILDPTGLVLSNVTLQSSTVLHVPYSTANERTVFDVSSAKTRYSISVQALQETSYSIKASKKNITRRIFENIPQYIFCQAGVAVVLEFLNLHPSDNMTNSLNILADVVEDFNNHTTLQLINAAVLFQSENGGAAEVIQLSSSIQSGNALNWQLPRRLGTYYINLTTSKSVMIAFILAKESIIHLSPSANVIMQKEAVFELFSGRKLTMIEVFTCWGDTGVDSSHSYSNFSRTRATDSSEIIMEHNNYGGHYVISAEDINEEYFIRVFSRNAGADIGYLINYHFYDKGEVLPYKLINMLSSNITYSLAPTTITFSISQILVDLGASVSISNAHVEYRLYVSSNRTRITEYANCRLQEVYTSTVDSASASFGSVSFQFDLKRISDIVGGSSTYFVGGEAVVSITTTPEADSNYPDSLRVIYEVVQLANVAAPVVITTSKLIVVWIVLPFAIAGVLLYLSLKYCMQKYRGMVPSDLVQETFDDHSEKEMDNPAVDVSQSLQEVAK